MCEQNGTVLYFTYKQLFKSKVNKTLILADNKEAVKVRKASDAQYPCIYSFDTIS